VIGGAGLGRVCAAHLVLASWRLVCYGAAGVGVRVVMLPEQHASAVERWTTHKRGRVMALYSRWGRASIRSAVCCVGALAEGAGPRVAIAVCGAVRVATGGDLLAGERRGDRRGMARIAAVKAARARPTCAGAPLVGFASK